MKKSWLALLALMAWCALPIPRVIAVTITADYSSLGTVYQDAAGSFFNSAGIGRTDVTATFKLDISQAFSILQSAITLPWNETITFKLADLGPDAVANSGIDTFDGDGANNTTNRPATSTIQFNTHAGFPNFLDPTPGDNTEFDMSIGAVVLGGGFVNNKRFGPATDTGGARDRWDFLTLVLHETEHSLGISSGSQRFLSLAGATGTDYRTLTISKTLSGLPNDFDIPIVRNSAHYSGKATDNDTFGFAVVAEPGWQIGQRALPTCLDILGIGQVEGAAANQINCPAVPEPSTLLLFAVGLTGLISYCWRRR